MSYNNDFFDSNSNQGNQYGYATTNSTASVSQQFYDPNSFYTPNPQQNYYSDWTQERIYTPAQNVENSYAPNNEFENEPPLLEELGINFDHIFQKTKCVLNPFAKPHESIIHDEDLAGPLVFCIAYGFSLLLVGKIQFGYIYGITALGCLSMYALLNLMSENGVSAMCIGSTLGYCLLPMVLLSFISSVISLNGFMGLILSVFFILWCSISSSKLFVNALNMSNQQMLVLYPCFLLYGIFALLNVF